MIRKPTTHEKQVKDFNRHFAKEDAHEESASLVILEMHIKTTLRCHFTPPEMAWYNRRWPVLTEMWRNWNPHELLVEMESGIATLEGMFLKQLSVNFVSDLTLLLLGIYPRELKIHGHTKIIHAFSWQCYSLWTKRDITPLPTTSKWRDEMRYIISSEKKSILL